MEKHDFNGEEWMRMRLERILRCMYRIFLCFILVFGLHHMQVLCLLILVWVLSLIRYYWSWFNGSYISHWGRLWILCWLGQLGPCLSQPSNFNGKWLLFHLILFFPVKIVERELTHACVFFSGDEQKQMRDEQFSFNGVTIIFGFSSVIILF